jgi:hypothetical protein
VNKKIVHAEVQAIKCGGCPNSLKPRSGETAVQLFIRAMMVERWKISKDKTTLKCSDCVEKQVKKAAF